MNAKANAFAGRPVKKSKKRKTIVQRIAKRLATWIVEREDRIREVRLNREAADMNRRLDWAAEVAARAAEMRKP